MKLGQIAVWSALLGAVFAACTRVEEAGPPAKVPIASGGFAGEPAGPGSASGKGGDGAGDEPSGGAGAPGSVELGLWPTFATDPSRPTDAQAVLAAVSALSVGSTILPLAERWDVLSGSTGSPRAAAWARLDAMSKPYRERGGGMALCIDVVDRRDAAWPFSATLDSEQAASAMRRTIDEVLARYAGQLSHLCFGYEVDRYLARASESERQRLLDFLKQSVSYASQHPMRGSRTALGVALTLGALTEANDAPLDDLLLGDEAVAVYDPLDRRGQLKPPASVEGELSSALETLSSRPGIRLPLSVFELGYPSAEDAGSSEGDQSAFYDALFATVGTRSGALGFLGIFGLGDRASADCEAEAQHFGGSAEALAERALARCSMGLRAESDKPAWASVLSAFSRYR